MQELVRVACNVLIWCCAASHHFIHELVEWHLSVHYPRGYPPPAGIRVVCLKLVGVVYNGLPGARQNVLKVRRDLIKLLLLGL